MRSVFLNDPGITNNNEWLAACRIRLVSDLANLTNPAF